MLNKKKNVYWFKIDRDQKLPTIKQKLKGPYVNKACFLETCL